MCAEAERSGEGGGGGSASSFSVRALLKFAPDWLHEHMSLLFPPLQAAEAVVLRVAAEYYRRVVALFEEHKAAAGYGQWTLVLKNAKTARAAPKHAAKRGTRGAL